MKILTIRDAPGGNYERKVEELILSGKVKRGEAHLVRIRHDDWCRIFRGKPCNCDPDIVLEKIERP